MMHIADAPQYPTRLPALAVLGASVTMVMFMAAAAKWLQAGALSVLGPSIRLTFAAVAALSLIGTVALAAVILRWLQSRFMGSPMPPIEAARQAREVVPCLTQMNDTLGVVLQYSEQSTQSMIERISSIHQMSSEQLEQTITRTRESGQALAEVVKDKVMVDSQLGAILTMFVETQEAEAQSNLERIARLQSVKDLTTMVDEISDVARQTNFLSINAAIEAARAGESGRSFAVLAAEIRQLSQQTAKVAVDITSKIQAVTVGIDQELSTAMEGSGLPSNTRNMRQVVADVAAMQARFVQSMGDLQLHQVSESILSGHRDLVSQLTEALGQMQSQDVVHQQIESVQQSLVGVDALLQGMADQLHDQPWAPDTMTVLLERLQAQARRDFMQHRVGTDTNGAEPKIELF